jgi:hypothetical protein
MFTKCLNRDCPDREGCARPYYDTSSTAYLSRAVSAARRWDCFVPRVVLGKSCEEFDPTLENGRGERI